MKMQLGETLYEIEECPHCKRTVLAKNVPATGFIAKCGRRLVNLAECGKARCPEHLTEWRPDPAVYPVNVRGG